MFGGLGLGGALQIGGGILGALGGAGGKGDPATSKPLYYDAFKPAADKIGSEAERLLGSRAPVYGGELTAPMFSPTLAGAGAIEDMFYGGDPLALQAAMEAAGQGGNYQSQYETTPLIFQGGMTGYESQAGAGLEGLAARALGVGERFSPQGFNSQVPAYMNPYINNVLDTAQDRARRRMLESQVSREGAAAQSGAFGGSRLAVQNSLAERDYNEQMAGMEADLLDRAFQMAQGQYNTGTAGNIAAEQQAINQGLQAFEGIGQMGGNLGDRRTRLAIEEENARQFAERARIAAAELNTRSAGTLGTLAGQQQGMGYDRINSMMGLGDLQRDYAQEINDRDFEQFMYQAGYPIDLIAQIKNVIGSPSGTESTPARAPAGSRILGGLQAGIGYGSKIASGIGAEGGWGI